MFTVSVPFGPFDSGDTLTAETIRQTVPGCDLDRLVRLGSLVPVGHLDVGTLADPTASQEQAEDVIADLHAKVLAAEEKHDVIHGKLAEAIGQLAAYREHLKQTASGTMNVQFLRDEGDHKAGDIVSPTAVAGHLAEYLDSGAVGWTEKPAPAAPATAPATTEPPKDDDTAEIVAPAPAKKKK